MGIILIILYIALGLSLSHNISNPILKLKKAAAEIYNGNYKISADVSSKDEIGDLADIFNVMTKSLKYSRKELKDYSKTLEVKVKQRTKELESKNKELEKFNKLAVGRELKMIELRKKIKELEEKVQNK